MENLLAGLELLARWDVILALIVGSVGGVIIGAIPGVGPAVAIAILLPATFSLDPIVGLTMLLGIYGSSMYGGFTFSNVLNKMTMITAEITAIPKVETRLYPARSVSSTAKITVVGRYPA